MDKLNLEFFGNSLKTYLIAACVFVLGITILKIFKTVMISHVKKFSKKTNTELDDILIDGIRAIHWPFFVFASFYFSLTFIKVNEKLEKIFLYIFLITAIYYSIKFFENIIDYTVKVFVSKQEEKNDDTIIKLLGTIIKILLWVGAVLLLLSNMGINITSLIAGLGVGGIAIALALQNVLGDLFSSLSIYFDKPFKVGDFVKIGENAGTVERIGLKTTRIKTLLGEELVVANSELTKSQLNNFGAMKRRRVVFNVGVTYDTPVEKVKKISHWIKNIIETHAEKTEVNRIHFSSFGDFSLIFETVYYVNSGDYNDYMDIQENINIKIMEKFEENNIEIAFPTQTIYLKNS